MRNMYKNSCILLVAISLYFLSFPFFTLAADTSSTVSVEAEGSGETKMAALKEAWTDAVRKAVGMYMASKSEALNDELTEQIAAYSRGQVNSFEILSEKSENGIWHVKIKANVDKDIMRETVAASDSQKISIDGANLASQIQSASDQKKDAIEVLKASGLLDFSKCLDYNVSLDKYTVKGKPVFMVRHVLKMNLDKFRAQATELEKIIAKFATAKKSIALNAVRAKEAFKIISQKEYDIQFNWNRGFMFQNNGNTNVIENFVIYYPALTEKFSEYPGPENEITYGSIGRYSNHDVKISISEPSIQFNKMPALLDEKIIDGGAPICFVKNASQTTCYAINEELFTNITHLIRQYDVQFSTANGDKDDIIAISPEIKFELIQNWRQRWLIVSPMLISSRYSNHAGFGMDGQYCALIEFQRLDLDASGLIDMKNLFTKYTLTPTDR